MRLSQGTVLKKWNEQSRFQQDIIIKMPTGHGKTLVGLLMLQSYLNENIGPVMYICPDNYLVNQTVQQAASFGIKTTQIDKTSTFPREFINSEAILVTNIQMLFNGKSRFGVSGLGREIVKIGALLIDDAHKCLDKIREQFSININRYKEGEPNPLFNELWSLLKESIKSQKSGTYLDVENEKDTISVVPYWTWFDKKDDVLKILSRYTDDKESLFFVWDLLKNRISETTCIISGARWPVPKFIDS